MREFYVIKNRANQLWNADNNSWCDEPTFFTVYGKETYELPMGGFWVLAVEM